MLRYVISNVLPNTFRDDDGHAFRPYGLIYWKRRLSLRNDYKRFFISFYARDDYFFDY
jgi:hypothetical protein